MKLTRLSAAALFMLFALFGAAQAAEGDIESGKAKSANCAGCHGAAGEGVGINPPLAGLDAAYLIEQLQAYKTGERQNGVMQMFAGQLSDEDMANIAAYYASLGGE